MFQKSRACVKRQRPVWWTPEGVLGKLQAGEFIGVICQQASDEITEMGSSVGVASLRAEVSKWCETASWGEQLTAALNLWKRTSSGSKVLSKDWHDDFFFAMERCEGNAEKAAKAAGIGYGIVLALTDKRNKCYDPDFTERFRIAELERIGRVREKQMNEAETGEGKLAMRAGERLLESALPGLHATRQTVEVSGKVAHDHKHEHTHGISGDLARELVLASQNRVRRLSKGREEADDEDRVIELRPLQREEVPS